MPGTYRCSCKPGYKGDFCEESVFICDSRTCLNGGYCIGNTTISLSASSCLCPNGYTGKYCEAVVNPCSAAVDPCGSNGKCLYSAPGQFYCKCTNECYFGDLCGNSTDPCAGNQCLNGGVCVGNMAACNYNCTCPSGFTGMNCEINTDPCLKLTCLNGGTCVRNSLTKYENK